MKPVEVETTLKPTTHIVSTDQDLERLIEEHEENSNMIVDTSSDLHLPLDDHDGTLLSSNNRDPYAPTSPNQPPLYNDRKEWFIPSLSGSTNSASKLVVPLFTLFLPSYLLSKLSYYSQEKVILTVTTSSAAGISLLMLILSDLL